MTIGYHQRSSLTLELSAKVALIRLQAQFFSDVRPRGYKTLFMLNSTKDEISTAHTNLKPTHEEVSCFKSHKR